MAQITDILPSVPPEPADPDHPLSARVLVVEDSMINQEVARELLTHLGCEVHCVDNGHEAIDALASDRFDVVFMDCLMPVMDGYEATRTIRLRESQEGLEPVPIIAMTAGQMVDDREQCLDAGMDDFLSKPFGTSELCSMLGRWQEPHPSSASGHNRSPEDVATSDTSSVIDESVWSEMTLFDRSTTRSLLPRVLSLFLETTPARIESIATAVHERSGPSARKQAHTLKSNCRYIGAHRLAEICKKVESLPERDDWDTTSKDLLGEMQVEYVAVQQHVRQFLTDSAGASRPVLPSDAVDSIS